MNETTLISTFYSFQPFVAAAHAFSPSRIILIIADDTKKRVDVKDGISKVKELYGGIASIKVLWVKGFDVLEVAKKTVDLIEREQAHRIVVNVTGGWKLLAQGVMYGCYARPEMVSKIVCNNIETNTIVELPKLSYGLIGTKRELLQEIAKRKDRPISEIAKKLNRTRGMLYQHLKELKGHGYVDEKFYITDAGRLALL